MGSSSRRRPHGERNLPRLPGILVLILLLASCQDDPTELEPTMGFIEVTTMTEGEGVFPDSYTILFDGEYSGKVGPNDVFTISYVPRGRHWVELSGVPEHCQPQPKPRPLTVEPKTTLTTTFLLRCREVED